MAGRISRIVSGNGRSLGHPPSGGFVRGRVWNPAIILLSLSIWGTILGFIGLIIALPLTTLCLSYYKRFILHEYNELDSRSLAHQPKQEEINSDLIAKK